MTLDELGTEVSQQFPEDTKGYGPRTVAVSFLNDHPQFLECLSPLARMMYEAIIEPIETDWHLFHPKAKEEEDKTHAIQQRESRVRSLHEMEMLIESSARGVPRDILGSSILQQGQFQSQLLLMTHQTNEQMRLETHRISEQIRLETEKKRLEVEQEAKLASIALESGRETVIHPHKVLIDLKEQLFTAYDERHSILTSDSPTKAKKLTVLNRTIKMLEVDLYERAGQTLVSSNDRAGLGTGTQDTETSGHKNTGPKPDSK